MKIKCVTVLVLCIYSICSVGQDIKESEVPTTVITTFRSKYPGAYVYEWEYKKKEKRYEGEFMSDGIKYEASFDPNGSWLWTSTDIEKGSLPAVVLSGLSDSDYGTWEVDDVEKRDSPAGVTYLVEVENGKREMVVRFRSDGSIEGAVNKK